MAEERPPAPRSSPTSARPGGATEQLQEPVRMSSSFDYDADYFGADTADKEDEALSWRLDPETSLSDWTVVVHCQDSGSSETYHVHKNILAVGRCKSDYFASLFRNSGRLSESNSDTSQITLDDAAASVFPVLLDFMYSPVHRIDVTTENAVPLRYMAQYFGIRLLHKRVMEFVSTDMKLDNVSTYISQALVFHDERMLSLAANVCVDNIHSMDKSSALLESIDPSFFLRILSSAEIDTCCESSHLSIIVAAYCTKHKDDLDANTFEQITAKTHLPLIHRDAAMPLLQLEGQVREAFELDPPSCLQRRCTKVLALSWQDLISKETVDSCKTLPSPILTELLKKSLSVAKQHCSDVEQSRQGEAVKFQQHFQENVTSFETRQKALLEEMKKMQKDSAEKISQLRAAVAERDRQMMEYEKELNKFVRLPVTHTFRSTGRDTYHHLSGNEPFDTATTQYDRFGRNRPSAIPQFADSTEDGFLYTERKGSSNDRWPIYYYKDE